MFGELLVGTGDWYSTRCKLTWKLKVTPSSRVYFQLAVSTLPIDEKECGLLPTVSAGAERPCAEYSTKSQSGRCLATMANVGLLPTPIASDIHHAERVQKLKDSGAETMASRKLGANRPNGIMDYPDFNGMLPTPQTQGLKTCDSQGKTRFMDLGLLPTPNASDYRSGMANRVGQKHNQSLNDRVVFQVRNGMLPTCTTRDWKGARTTEALEKAGRNGTNSLPDAFAQTGKTSQLNDQFVCEMMGFPINYLSLW